MSADTDTTSSPATAARLGGRRFALIFAGSLITCFVFIIWQFFASYWPDGEVLMSVEHDQGVLAVHDDERGHVHVVQRDLQGEGVWSVGLFGVPSQGGITAGEGLVTVRVIDFEGVLETHAFELDTGEFRWRSGRGENRLPEGEDALQGPTLWSGEAHYELDGWENELIAMDRSTGEESWREPLGDGATVRLVGERACVTSTSDTETWCRGLSDDTRQALP